MSVASILQALAENAGQAQLRKGAVYGNLARGVAQVPAQIIDDREKEALRARQQAIQNEQLGFQRNADTRATADQTMQEKAAALAQKRLATVNAGLTAAMGDGSDPTKFDAKAAFKAVSDLGDPSAIQDVIAKHKSMQATPIKGAAGDVFFDPDTHAPIPGMNVPEKQTPESRQIFLLSKKNTGVPLTKQEQAEVDAFSEVKAPKGERSLDQQLLESIKNGDTEAANTITQTMKTAAAAKGDPAAIAAANRQAATIAAQIAQQSRAQGFTESQAGRKELTDKIEAPYLDAREKADTLKSVVALAKGGNKEAANVQALLGTLGLVTSEGVKRINTTELDQVAGAGSLFDKIKAKAGSIVSGQPLPTDLQNDLVQLAGMLEQSARKKYESGFKRVTDRYKLTDEQPIAPVVETAPASTLTPGLTALGKR